MTDYKYTWSAWIEAFTIFQKYEPDKWASVVAEHDQLYVGHELREKMTPAEKRRLTQLGFYWDKDIPSFVKNV
jgi:hypothetical protein